MGGRPFRAFKMRCCDRLNDSGSCDVAIGEWPFLGQQLLQCFNDGGLFSPSQTL